jgi:hypothetical protein
MISNLLYLYLLLSACLTTPTVFISFCLPFLDSLHVSVFLFSLYLLFLSMYLSLYLHVSLNITLSFVCLSLYVSLFVSLSLNAPVSPLLFLSFYHPLYLQLCHTISLCPSLLNSVFLSTIC